MTYRHLPNWPPAWMWIDGGENKHPRGELGTLRDIQMSAVLPQNRCFLTMEYDGATYMGCLLCDDATFCAQLVELLQTHYGRSIQDIGDLDVSHTL